MISQTLYLLPTLKLIAVFVSILAVVEVLARVFGEGSRGEDGFECGKSSALERCVGVVGAVERDGNESVDEIESELIDVRRGEEARVEEAAMIWARHEES